MRSLAIPMTMKEGSDDWYSPVQAPGRVYFMYTKRKAAVADMSSVQTKDGLRDRDDHFFLCLLTRLAPNLLVDKDEARCLQQHVRASQSTFRLLALRGNCQR